ncbi:MAG: hypothetical protein ACKVVT_05790 [Dehalococcoidia bacterium]
MGAGDGRPAALKFARSTAVAPLPRFDGLVVNHGVAVSVCARLSPTDPCEELAPE